MIEQIRLDNFQKHKETTLNLSPKINVITGQSDQGKSSVIRGLYWLFFNSLTGNEFINWESDNCSVSAKINEHSIARTKSKSNNSYIINGERYDAVRSNIPKQLQEIIKLTETNIQLQDDPYFLLFESSGEVARRLNELVGIDQIDSSLQFINQYYRKQFSTHQMLTEEVNSKKEELKQFESLPEVEKAINKYNKLIEKHKTLSESIESLEDYCLKLSDFDYVLLYKQRLIEAEKLIARYSALLTIVKNAEHQLDKLNTCIKLDDLLTEQAERVSLIENAESRLKKYNSLLNSVSKIPIESISNIIIELNDLKSESVSLKEQIKSTISEFSKLKKKLGICPLCNQNLGE